MNSNRFLKAPISSRKLTTRESIVLLESSKLNGSIFPPWAPGSKIDELDIEQPMSFLDKTHFTFSEIQQQQFACWERLPYVLKARSISIVVDQAKLGFCDLLQDATTDCSVVSSLCAISSRTQQGFSDLYSTMFYPWDHGAQKPRLSESGRYIFKFFFNGSFRRVIIDDRLPISKNERSLFVVDRRDPTNLWPALLEKAYLKVRGGYDFPGSNSGTDLSIMTGWIPEQIFLQR